MTRLVSAIPVVAEQTGRAIVLVGGLAVMCRLPVPHRATTDLDTVDRRADGENSQLELLVSAGAIRSGPSGALVQTPFGAVQVDVLQVTDAEVDDLPDDPTDRLHVLSHAWAAASASGLQLAADGLPPLTVAVAEPGPLIAMKLQSSRRSARRLTGGCRPVPGSPPTDRCDEVAPPRPSEEEVVRQRSWSSSASTYDSGESGPACQGRAVPATIAGPIPMPAHRAEPGSEAGQLLRDLRDEERW